MNKKQLFYGQFTVSPTERYTNLRGIYTQGSNVITNIVTTSGDPVPWNLMKVGQRLKSSGELTDFATITAFDPSSAEITVNQTALSTPGTAQFTQWWVAEDTYFLESGSLLTPNGDIRVENITGSNDSYYIEGSPSGSYAILGAQAVGGTEQVGVFHKYNITDTFYVKNSVNEASYLITWGEKGNEADWDSSLFLGTSQKMPIVSLTTTESLAPIYSRDASGLTLSSTSQFAAYQIEVQEFFDDLTISDISEKR